MNIFSAVMLAAVSLGAPTAQGDLAPEGAGTIPEIGHPYRLQPGDALSEPLAPQEERTESDEQTLDALAWFGLGELHESRGEYQTALSAYRKGIAADPKAVAIYRRLVPLEFNLGENEEGIEHALILVDLAPDDVGLMRQLSQILVSRGQVKRATDLVEKALKVQSVDRHSGQFLLLQRDLGLLYGAAGKTKPSADAFELLMDGIAAPETYGLSREQRQALLGKPEVTYEQFGETFLSAGRFERAIEAFREAAKARGKESGILPYNLARVYVASEKFEEAEREIESYLAEGYQDRGAAAFALFAEVLEKQGKKDTYRTRLKTIVAEQPDNNEAKLALADALVEQEEFEQARNLYQTAVDGKPSVAGYVGLARVARIRGATEGVLDWLSRATVAGASDDQILDELQAIATKPEMTEALLAGRRQAWESDPTSANFATALLCGKLAIEAERVDDAEYFYRLAMRLRPDKKDVLLSELGIAFLIAEENEKAVATFKEALEVSVEDGTRLNVLFRLAQAQEFSGATDEALDTIQSALDVAPQAGLLHFQKGWIYFHAGKLEEAEAVFKKVLAEFPQDADVMKQTRLTLSALYVQRRDFTQGVEVLEVLYEENPEDIAVCNDLGYLYADQGIKLEQAEEMVRRAVSAEPENAAYLDSLGWVLFKQDRFEEALPHLEKAVSLPDGDDATLHEHLGDVYDKLNRPDDAMEQWKIALEQGREDNRGDEELVPRLEKKVSAGE